MTTTVRVDAAHVGCDVEVDAVDPVSGTVLATRRVPSGHTDTFYAHSGANILVRELGPEGIPEAPSPSPAQAE